MPPPPSPSPWSAAATSSPKPPSVSTSSRTPRGEAPPRPTPSTSPEAARRWSIPPCSATKCTCACRRPRRGHRHPAARPQRARHPRLPGPATRRGRPAPHARCPGRPRPRHVPARHPHGRPKPHPQAGEEIGGSQNGGRAPAETTHVRLQQRRTSVCNTNARPLVTQTHVRW